MIDQPAVVPALRRHGIDEGVKIADIFCNVPLSLLTAHPALPRASIPKGNGMESLKGAADPVLRTGNG